MTASSVKQVTFILISYLQVGVRQRTLTKEGLITAIATTAWQHEWEKALARGIVEFLGYPGTPNGRSPDVLDMLTKSVNATLIKSNGAHSYHHLSVMVMSFLLTLSLGRPSTAAPTLVAALEGAVEAAGETGGTTRKPLFEGVKARLVVHKPEILLLLSSICSVYDVIKK